MGRSGIACRTSGGWQFVVNQSGHPHASQIFAHQHQPAVRGECFVRYRQLEWQNRLKKSHRTL